MEPRSDGYAPGTNAEPTRSQRNNRRRVVLLVLLAIVAVVIAVVGFVLGGLALVLAAIAALFFPLRWVLLGGVPLVLVGVVATSIDPDECRGECLEAAGRGFDPFVLVLLVPLNLLGWCVGAVAGDKLRPLVRGRRPPGGVSAA